MYETHTHNIYKYIQYTQKDTNSNSLYIRVVTYIKLKNKKIDRQTYDRQTYDR